MSGAEWGLLKIERVLDYLTSLARFVGVGRDQGQGLFEYALIITMVALVLVGTVSLLAPGISVLWTPVIAAL